MKSGCLPALSALAVNKAQLSLLLSPPSKQEVLSNPFAHLFCLSEILRNKCFAVSTKQLEIGICAFLLDASFPTSLMKDTNA